MLRLKVVQTDLDTFLKIGLQLSDIGKIREFHGFNLAFTGTWSEILRAGIIPDSVTLR